MGIMVADSGGRLRMTDQQHYDPSDTASRVDPNVVSFVVGPDRPQLVVIPSRTDATVWASTRHRLGRDARVLRSFAVVPVSAGGGQGALA